MGKIILWMMLTVGLLAQSESLTDDCLSCHKVQQIPNKLIYRRYLLKYSSASRIEAAMLAYLKEPKQSQSIMPPQFFLKFPMKPSLGLDDTTLKQGVREFIEAFDVKKKLRVKR